jgi:multicomponent Na+:H+ antiporter subunit A
MSRSLILDTTVRLVFDAALVLSLYLLFAGHNQPGGGFVGGLVAAAALALRYVSGGYDELQDLLHVRPWTFSSIGLALAVGAALVPLVLADAPLDQQAYEADLVVLGKVKVTTATIFDTGVYLIVVGLVLMLVEALGDAEPDEDESRDLADGAS